MRVLILGSTGMVGSEVLKECLKTHQITDIIVINREQMNTNKKVKKIVHTNFLNFSNIRKEIINHDICFYCIGVYTGDVSKEKFKEITYDYLTSLAKTIESNKTIFCLLSAGGANSKSNILFAKWKGKAEDELMKLNFKHIYIFRPAYIYPSDKTKQKKSIFYKMIEILYPLFKKFSSFSITSNQLAKVMIQISLSNTNNKIFKNKEIRQNSFYL